MAKQVYADQPEPLVGCLLDPLDINDLYEEHMNFTSGMFATHEINKNPIECLDKCTKSVEKLIKERLNPEEDKEEATKSFFGSNTMMWH